MTTPYHTPALLDECISGLCIDPKENYADLTTGAAGHATAIYNKLSTGRLLALDQDPNVLKNISSLENIHFYLCNFKYFKRIACYSNLAPFKGVIADLGVSFSHFDSSERGFTFRTDAPLDMRMNPHASITASEVVNTYSQEDLQSLFLRYGELKNAHAIAKHLTIKRNEKAITTSFELREALTPFLGKAHLEHKFLAKVFQALRIEVNHEMETLEDMLTQLPSLVKPGGRIAIISYHSLEDRIVKNFFRTGNMDGKLNKDLYGNICSPFKLITKKAIVPSEEEIARNNRARSAKLRIVEMI